MIQMLRKKKIHFKSSEIDRICSGEIAQFGNGLNFFSLVVSGFEDR